MNTPVVDQVVNAVLYEGHILYPYRASSKKNRQRFTFGRVYPEAYSVSQNGAEPFVMRTECLAKDLGGALLHVTVRFLQPMARDIMKLHEDTEGVLIPVTELRVEDKLYQTWQEATERTVDIPAQPLSGGNPPRFPFSFEESHTREPIRGSDGSVLGAIIRRQSALSGVVELTFNPVDESVHRVSVQILNRAPIAGAELKDADAVLMRTFTSTHVIFRIENGEFLSLIDTPPAYANAAAACKNIGAWPVLVGEEGARDTMLASPIILYDYPAVAPESPGDLFDSMEIDEILTLRIMTLTDEEKREMRDVDEYARRILERTEDMRPDHLLKMHGVMRETRTLNQEDFFNPNTRLEETVINGVRLKKGDRVRVRPKSRADIMDMALAGKTAVIEAVEQDAEDRVHLALVLDDDPGQDLGMLRQPGHRFFYGPEEVEPLEKAPL